MKSLLYQGVTPFVEPPTCAAIPCRTEVPVTIRKGGKLFKFVLRDKLVPEDMYLVLLRAAAFAVQTGTANVALPPARSVRDFLIKDSVVI
jgi:hypothetical protein